MRNKILHISAAMLIIMLCFAVTVPAFAIGTEPRILYTPPPATATPVVTPTPVITPTPVPPTPTPINIDVPTGEYCTAVIIADPPSLVEGRDIQLTVKVSNSEKNRFTMTDVHVRYDNKDIAKFSAISPGKTSTANGIKFTAKDNMLGREIFFSVQWKENGAAFSKTVGLTLAKEKAKPAVKISVSTDKDVVQPGEEIILTYEVHNNGNISAKDIRISDSNLGFAEKIDLLKAGQAKTYKIKRTLSASTLSIPVVYYTCLDDQYSYSGESRQIFVNKADFSIDMKLDKTSVNAGDSVKISCTVSNTGSINFTNVTITEPTLGTVGKITYLPAGETVDFSFDFIPKESMHIMLNASAKDSEGTVYRAYSGNYVLSVNTGSNRPDIKIDIKPSRTALGDPGEISFNITISNNGNADAMNIVLEESKFGVIDTSGIIRVGEEHTATAALYIPYTMDLHFTVAAYDKLGSMTRYNADVIKITIGGEGPSGDGNEIDNIADLGEEITKYGKAAFYWVFGIFAVALVLSILLWIIISTRSTFKWASAYSRRLSELDDDDDDDEYLDDGMNGPPAEQ